MLMACTTRGAALESHHKFALSQVGPHPAMTLDVARTYKNKEERDNVSEYDIGS